MFAPSNQQQGLQPVIRINTGGSEVSDGPLPWEEDTTSDDSKHIFQWGNSRPASTETLTAHASVPSTWPAITSTLYDATHNGYQESTQQLIYRCGGLELGRGYTVRVGYSDTWNAGSILFDIIINDGLYLQDEATVDDEVEVFEVSGVIATPDIWLRSNTVTSSASWATSGLTVNLPTGYSRPREGDLILLQATRNDNDFTWTTPSGYSTDSDLHTTTTGEDQSIATFWKIATSDAESNPSLAVSGGDTEEGAVICTVWHGVNPQDPLDVTPTTSHVTTNGSLASPNTVAFPSITTVTDGAVVVCHAGVTGSGGSFSADPTGYTEIAENLGSQENMVAYYKTVATAGAESPGAAAWTGWSTDDGLFSTVALRPSGSIEIKNGTANNEGQPWMAIEILEEPTGLPQPEFRSYADAAVGFGDITINKPTGTVEDDVMVAFLLHGTAAAQTPTGPSGWTELNTEVVAAGYSVTCWYKVAGASEGSSYQWTDYAASNDWAGIICTYSGVDTTNPVNDSSGSEGASTTHSESVTTTVDRCLLVGFAGTDDGADWAWSSTENMVERAELYYPAESDINIAAYDQLSGFAGVHSREFTKTGSVDPVVWLVALRPDAG